MAAITMFFEVLRDYGGWSALFVFVAYLVLKGRLSFTYPRDQAEAKKERDS